MRLLIEWYIPNMLLEVSPKKNVAYCLVWSARWPWPVPTLAHQSKRKLSAEVLHCCMTGMRRSSISLPPHVILIDIKGVKVPLYNMVTYDTQIFSCVEVSLCKMWTKNNACSSKTNSYRYLIGTLSKLNGMICRMSISVGSAVEVRGG